MDNDVVFYNFLVPDLDRVNLADRDWWRVFNDGRYCWAAATYFHLCTDVDRLRLSTACDPNAINIGHYRTWIGLKASASVFAVVCQADWPTLPWAHFHIVQNRQQLGGTATAWVPLWPQAQLLPRRAPIDQIRRIGYLGRVDDSAQFENFCCLARQRGFQFIVRGEDNWNDFSDIDVAVSLRFLSRARIDKKPPSKLINAWIAGVPFVAMDEPAFTQVGRNGCDYFGVNSAEDVLDVVEMLAKSPRVVEEVVSRGRARALEFDVPATSARWTRVLRGPVVERYILWRKKRLCEKGRFLAQYSLWTITSAFRHALVRLANYRSA